jgi:CheY-like chemotaxis protein
LIVEDEGIIAQHVSMQLKKSRYQVTGIAQSSEEAITGASELKPDLILMDICIKGALDGIDTAAAIQRILDIPIIYLTAHSDRQTVDRAKVSGAYALLTKPIRRTALATSIEMALHKHRAERHGRVVVQRKQSEAVILYSVLTIARPHNPGCIPIAVLLLDATANELHARFREDLADVADDGDLDVVAGMAETVAERARDEGGSRLFYEFLDTLSNYMRMDDPRTLPGALDGLDCEVATDVLFKDLVQGRS